ncbi:MAG: hypothetical protein KDK89_18950 [Alphaproteobacteria bacterium]|nr:hypothetical protein [Alphaproteobacteria bacterium]
MTGDRETGVGQERRPWRYILSAGRTGTVFLESFLNAHCPGVAAVHEPSPTREQMMLANLRNDVGVGGSLLAWHFDRCRRQRDASHPGIYVEINPFLCAMTDLLPDPDRPLRIVHMVREPSSWAVSMTAFKASTRFRHVIDYVPFAKPYPAPRPAGWSRMPEIERALWRWHWCNSRIMALKDATPHYCLVRYEDLFRGDAADRNAILASVVETLGLDCRGPFEAAPFAERANPAPNIVAPPSPDAVRRICGSLASNLGYTV